MGLLDLPHKLLKFVQSLRVLWRHVCRHPRVYGSLLFLIASYVCAFMALVQPARSTVSGFLTAIDNGRVDEAWELLDPAYRQKYSGGMSLFENGYSTTIKHTEIDVDWAWGPGNLARSWKSAELSLRVQFTVIDRMHKDHLYDPLQRFNTLWLQLKHPTRIDMLREGSLPDDVTSLEMRRRCTQSIVVVRKPSGWRIASITPVSTTLVH